VSSDGAGRSLSVVVPAYNEARRIADSLDRLVAHLAPRPAPFEILVVDDGSIDRTAEIVEAHTASEIRLLRQPRNRGKGAAVRRGVLSSVMSRVLLCDADLSTPIEELDRLEQFIDSVPIVVASRLVAGARVERTSSRRIVSRLFGYAMRTAGVGSGIRDTQCGFKLLRGDLARALFAQMTLDGFAFDIELLALAKHHGLELREVGVTWNDSDESTVRLFRDAPRMLRDALAVRRRLKRPVPALNLDSELAATRPKVEVSQRSTGDTPT